MSQMVFLVMLGRLREGGERRRGWITTTPKGLGWLYNEFGLPKEGRFAVQASSRDNPYLPETFVPDLEGSYSGAFRKQEIEGEWVVFEGLIYPQLEDERRYLLDEPPQRWGVRYGGIDWGYTHPAAFGVMGFSEDSRRGHVYEECHRSHMGIDDIVARVKELDRRYTVANWFCGHDEPGNIDRLRREGINAVRADTSVQGGISDVSSMIEADYGGVPGLTFSSAVPLTYSDCRTYRWQVDRQGNATGKPVKEKDDGADWIRYCVRGAKSELGVRPGIAIL
jgi:phage terminase large subunit